MMSPRECCKRVLRFETTDYIPNYDSSLMNPSILDEWHQQGLPNDMGYQKYFGLHGRVSFSGALFDPIPGVPDQGVIFEDDTKRVIRDGWGQEAEWPKSAGMAEGCSRVIRHAIETREDWECIRDQFNPDEPRRFPAVMDNSSSPLWIRQTVKPPYLYGGEGTKNWQTLTTEWEKQDVLMQLNGPSMIGEIKELMGFENFCIFLCTDLPLIEEIIETRTNLALTLIGRIMDEVSFDILHFWEDIAFNGGPILSPDIFEELTISSYRKLADLFLKKGGQIVSVDSDGDIHKLIPGWIKGGINNFWPLEVNAGMDITTLRKEYGRAFTMRGGINKYALLKSKEDIDREIERVAPVAEEGGYIPTLDHHVPPGVTFENYAYYMEKKKSVLGVA